ncbi:hypothetical protein F511_00014 [Dorcoceras hygrometricum]|nr:hypothetical protein F511_00014 [Dorcoceras hygrometricum]
MRTTKKYSYVLVIVCFLLSVSSINIALGEQFQVHVVNNLPKGSQPLHVHCASKDDEIYNNTLAIGGDVTWHFKLNFWWTTRYFCRFLCGKKDKAFDVFTVQMKSSCTEDKTTKRKTCVWYVRQDGFYYTDAIPPRDLRKIYDWV